MALYVNALSSGPFFLQWDNEKLANEGVVIGVSMVRGLYVIGCAVSALQLQCFPSSSANELFTLTCSTSKWQNRKKEKSCKKVFFSLGICLTFPVVVMRLVK